MTTRLLGLGRGQLAAIAVGSGVAVYCGVVVYGWQRKAREKLRSKSFARWSRGTVFLSGITVGVVGIATAMRVRRYMYPHPERVLDSVLPMLRSNNEVRDAIGSALSPGLFKAYAYNTKSMRWRRWGGLGDLRQLVSLKSRSLQMMFQMNGEVSSAMVSLSVCRQSPWGMGRGLIYSSLAVDLPNGERLLLKGSNSDVVFQGYTRLR